MAEAPLVLLILDGWGDAPPAADNAISEQTAPFFHQLRRRCPGAQLLTSGEAVGLPAGQMGNSEVGHLNLGAGRIVLTELSRIDEALADGSLASHPALHAAVEASQRGARIHLVGLLSSGGVHSHEDQIFGLIGLLRRLGAGPLAMHALLDGRDTPPRSARASLEALEQLIDDRRGDVVASVGGRYYAMDRDQRWERIAQAWSVIVDGVGTCDASTAVAALDAAYGRGESDEFVLPTVIKPTPIVDGDVVIHLNFRADRARQLSRALVEPGFNEFSIARRPRLARMLTMTEYAKGLPVDVLFAPDHPQRILADVVADAGYSQLRIAETEKYAHVTFFFSGGREQLFPGEDRLLVPSPKVATYDLQPEMSLPEVSAQLCAAIRARRHRLIVCNIANGDMVGHTGSIAAARAAVQAIDTALAEIVAALDEVGAEMLLTADHGNAEDLLDESSGQPHTQHTTNPVPLIYVGPRSVRLASGALRDVAPTMLELLGLSIPVEMTGRSLLIKQ